jgi:hypothetical protein
MKINVVEEKSLYLQQMEIFREARANKRHERDLHVCWKEMHTHMREAELKKEEELKQYEEALRKREEELRIQKEEFEKRKKKRVISFYCTH